MGLPTPMKLPRDWADNFEILVYISPILLSTGLGKLAERFHLDIQHSSRRRRSFIVFGQTGLSISFRLWTVNHQCSTFWSRRKANKKNKNKAGEETGGILMRSIFDGIDVETTFTRILSVLVKNTFFLSKSSGCMCPTFEILATQFRL